MANKWIGSTDEERWSSREEYDTKDEAIAEYPEEAGLDEGQPFYVGRVVPAVMLLPEMVLYAIDIDSIVERLQETAYEAVGEVAEDWNPVKDPAEAQNLRHVLTRALETWFAAKAERLPKFFQIQDVTDHIAPDDVAPPEVPELVPAADYVRRLVLIGRPGSGKGTMAVRLARSLGMEHVSSGELFRAFAQVDEELRRYLATGALVPDEKTNGIVVSRIHARDAWSSYILDGYPRTAMQAAHFDDIAQREKPERVLVFDAPDEVLYKRLERRATEEGRPEDGAAAAIGARMHSFEEATVPVIAYYEEQGFDVRHVDATGTPDTQMKIELFHKVT